MLENNKDTQFFINFVEKHISYKKSIFELIKTAQNLFLFFDNTDISNLTFENFCKHENRDYDNPEESILKETILNTYSKRINKISSNRVSDFISYLESAIRAWFTLEVDTLIKIVKQKNNNSILFKIADNEIHDLDKFSSFKNISFQSVAIYYSIEFKI